MRKLVISLNITPDGFCDHRAVIADEELHQYSVEMLKESDTVLFGRVTFELFKDYWPKVARDSSGTPAENEFAKRADTIEKVVCSKTLQETSWKNSWMIKENLKEEILKLKQIPGKNILVFGSPGLSAELIKLELVDEYRFCVQPIIAGSVASVFLKKKV